MNTFYAAGPEDEEVVDMDEASKEEVADAEELEDSDDSDDDDDSEIAEDVEDEPSDSE